MSEWPGLEINFNRLTQQFNVAVLSYNETETIPINSASGSFSIGNTFNIYDENYHTMMLAWSMNDNYSIQGTVSSLQQVAMIFDGTYFPNNNITWLGKKTPLSFNYDQAGDSTFFAIGGEFQGQQSSTSVVAFTQNARVYNGIIKEIVMWDRVLPDSGGYSQWPSQGSYWDQYANPHYNHAAADPITGTLKSLSGNVVLYNKFYINQASSLTAQDYAGSLNGGVQTNPTSGNTVCLFGSSFNSTPTYSLVDSNLTQPLTGFNSGYVLFSDENNIQRIVGTIFYDLGMIVFDNEYNNSGSGLPLLSTVAVSGMTFNQSLSTSNFYINNINFTSIERIETLIVNVSATGEMANITENPSGVNINSGTQVLATNAGYITTVGLYNDFNQLVAIAKLCKAVRKDIDHDVQVAVKLNF